MKTFTCTACKATKTEAVAKTTAHTYDHACDADCNICGETRTVTHNYNTSWSADKTNHWHECSACGNRQDISTHTPGAAATETHAQTCTICGYVIKAALEHTHNYSSTWAIDAEGHWNTCASCNETGNYAAHVFENACDEECEICGFAREIAHEITEGWESNADYHWHICSICGLKQDEAAHTPGAAATATTAQTCTACGYEIAPAYGIEETTSPTEVTQSNTQEFESFNESLNMWENIIEILFVVLFVAVALTFIILLFKKK